MTSDESKTLRIFKAFVSSTFLASISNMSFCGNVGSEHLENRVTSNGAVVWACKLSSTRVWPHFAIHHTTHNRANCAVCIICYDSKDNV